MPNVERKVTLVYQDRTFSGSVATIKRKLNASFEGGDLEGTVAFLLRVVPYPGDRYQRLVAIFDQIKGNRRDRLSKQMNLYGYHRFEIREEIATLIHELEDYLPRTFSLDDGFHPGKPLNPLAKPKPKLLWTVLFVGALLFLCWYLFKPETGPTPSTSVPPEPNPPETPFSPPSTPSKPELPHMPSSQVETEPHLRVSQPFVERQGRSQPDEILQVLQEYPQYVQLASFSTVEKAQEFSSGLTFPNREVLLLRLDQHAVKFPTKLPRIVCRVALIGFQNFEEAQKFLPQINNQFPKAEAKRLIGRCIDPYCVPNHIHYHVEGYFEHCIHQNLDHVWDRKFSKEIF